MTQELTDLLEARSILAKAYFATIGIGPAHDMVWRAVEYIDMQTTPIIYAALAEEEVAA